MGIILHTFLFCLLLTCVYSKQDILDNDCKESQHGNVLRNGQWYTYRYHGVVEGAAVGTSDRVTKMDMSCDLKIQHASECAFSLRLSNCKVSSMGCPHNAQEYCIQDRDLSILTSYEMGFTLSNGRILTILAHPDDPLYSVNIKRGIISAFTVSSTALENGEKDEHHTDVHGVCPWEVKSLGSGRAVSTKDMLHCAVPSRLDWNLSPYSLFWNMSFIQYLINSSTICQYERRNPDLKSINCHERHAIMLESTHNTTTAVQANIWYNLDLVDSGQVQNKEKLDRQLSRVSGIQYEYDATHEPRSEPEDFLPKAQKILSDLILTSEDEIRLFSITFFHDLVAWLRTGQDLNPFVESVIGCSFQGDKRPCQDWIKDQGLSFTQDALVQCNTLPCMKAFTYLATRDHVPNSYLNFVLYSWTNMHSIHPEYIAEILKICKEKKSRNCWLSLGAVINTYTNEYQHSHHGMPKGIEDSIGYLSSIIGKNCNIKEVEFQPGFNEEKKYDYMMVILKAIGNIGEVARTVNEEIVKQLYDCSQNQDLPTHIQVSAIEAMNKMASNDFMYEELLKLLQNQSESVELRLAAYNILVGHYGNQEFVSVLVDLVKTESVSQVKGYIASHLQQVLIAEDGYENKELSKNLNILLERLGFNIYSVHVDPSTTSHRTLRRAYGVLWDSEIIFNTLSAIPETLRSNLSVQIFDKFINLMEVGFKSGGWDAVIIRTRAVLSNVKKPNILQYLALIMQQIVGRPSRRPASQAFLSDRKMEENINKLHQLYSDATRALKPYIHTYIKMFGNELDFTSLEDVLSVVRKRLRKIGSASKVVQPTSDYSINSTHILRVIEAYQQFPTLMGLPLNWTTNATLAFSTKAAFKMDVEGKFVQDQIIRGRAFLHHSAALTFMNRMAIDFPTVTHIGIQANSSAYTSTQWELGVERPPSGVLKFSIKVPDKPQKPLQLFRTNQFVIHDHYEDIPDFDVSRVSKNWCLGERFVRDTGMKVCVDTSYVNVTHLVKPWFLMCGWAKWSLTAEKQDKGLQAYNMDVSFKNVNKSTRELKFHLKAPGSVLKRDIPVAVSMNGDTGEMTLDVRHFDHPSFEFVVSRTRILEGNQHTGYRSVARLKENGKEFQLTYNKESRTESRKPVMKNKTPTDEKTIATVLERDLRLETPHNSYQYKSEVHHHDGNMKADVLLAYENKDPSWRWLANILPAVFWQNERKASIELRANWRAPTIRGKDTRVHHTTSQLVVPHSTTELSTYSIYKQRHQQMYVNITKVEKTSGKLLTFANFTLNSRQKEGPKGLKEVRVYNLTIPRSSWAIEVNREKGDSERSYVIVLQRSKMVEKDSSDGMFVGWWNPFHSHRFEHKEWRSKLRLNLQMEAAGHLASELYSEIPPGSDRKSRTVHADVELTYPLKGVDQKLRFNGSFVWIKDPSTFSSFQKDFRLSSTGFNLHLDSHSVSMIKWRGEKKFLVMHKSSITNTKSGSSQGLYRLGIRIGPDGECPYVDMRHNISAHWIDFSSNITTKCTRPSKPLLMQLLAIDNKLRVPSWKLLDGELHQLYDFHLPGWESMNFTSGFMDINVTGEWNRASFDKKAIFKSKIDFLPSTEWHLRSQNARELVLTIKSADGPLKRLTLISQVEPKWKELSGTVRVMPQGSDEEHEDANFVFRLIGPNDILISANRSDNYRAIVMESLMKKICAVSERLREIAYNPNHEMNFYLQPETTLGQSFERLLDEMKETAAEMENEVRQSAEALFSFYAPSLQLLINVYTQLAELSNRTDLQFRQTIPGWAFYYFDVPGFLVDSLSHLKAPSGHVFYIHHPFYWEKLTDKPVLSERSSIGHLLKEAPIGRKKYAMIFGSTSVITFDGLVYEFPTYPDPSCKYLLTHDVRGRTFSAVSTSTAIELLFPGVAITIDGFGEIFINSSKVSHPVPYQSFNGKVTAIRGPGGAIVVRSSGLSVLCFTSQEFCIFELPSLFHGGTIGLLGNADGSSHNEFLSPDRRILEDAVALGKSYDVSGRPLCQLLEKTKPENKDYEAAKAKCSNLLPPLESCAKKVGFSIDSIRHACTSGRKAQVCGIINSVAEFCSHYGFEMKGCATCESRNGSHPWQQQAMFQLEVVLVVDQHHSLFGGDRAATKGIESFANNLDESFRSNGYSSVTFALVGFGGKGVQGIGSRATVHAVNNTLWVESKDVPSLLKTLQFKGQERGNGLEALKMATEALPHKLAVSKVLVFFTADDKEIWYSSRKVRDLQQLLEDTGFTLYTVASYPAFEKGKKVFGLRADGFIFPQKGGAAYLDFPTTPYAKLTSATRGAIFLRNFVEDNQNDFFFNEFAEEIAAKVGKEGRGCMRCTCLSELRCKPVECS